MRIFYEAKNAGSNSNELTKLAEPRVEIIKVRYWRKMYLY